MQNDVLKSIIEKFDKSILSFKSELLKLSFNKINTELIYNVKVFNNGVYTSLNHISSLSLDKNVLLIKPFDKKIINILYNSIIDLNLDLNVSIISDHLKISLPKPSEERRHFFVKKINKLNENFKISIRNIRREYIQFIKNKQKLSDISKDDEKILLKSIEDLTSKNINLIDELSNKKIQEILRV